MANAKVEIKDAKSDIVADLKATTEKAQAFARKGTLAYVGLYGLAYDRAKMRADQLATKSGELFETLVKKGEKIEEQGLELTKDAREKATELYSDGVATVKNVVPFGKREDRVEELEAEVTALNKKISALSKKASAPRKTTKTEKAA